MGSVRKYVQGSGRNTLAGPIDWHLADLPILANPPNASISSSLYWLICGYYLESEFWLVWVGSPDALMRWDAI